ncbi:hypothetical protein QYF36_024508 [Acer negundo]|nr:hypothetical protein QYF36_024508 [Acer negundo]
MKTTPCTCVGGVLQVDSQAPATMLNEDHGSIWSSGAGAGTGIGSSIGRSWGLNLGGSGTGGKSISSGQATIPPYAITKPTVPHNTKAPTSGFRCFNYGKLGHRFAECKKGTRKGLFTDAEEIIVEHKGDFEIGPVYDEERLKGDDGPFPTRKSVFF